MSALRLVLCGSVLLLLAGCIRYEETLNLIDQSGKGSLSLIMSRPERGMSELALGVRQFDQVFSEENLRKGLPGDITFNYKEIRENDRVTVIAAYGFEDAHKFAAWAATTRLPFNQISLVIGDKTVEYTRRFGPFDKEQADNVRKYAGDVVAVFRVIAPGRVKANNATRVDGSSATWEMRAQNLVAQSPTDLRAQFDASTPGWVFALIGLGAVAVVVVVVLARKAPEPVATPPVVLPPPAPEVPAQPPPPAPPQP